MKRNATSTLKIGLIALLGIIVLGYSLFQAQKLIRGPIIEISSPQNGSTFSQPLIEIKGRARNIAYLNLDGRKIFTDKDGYFTEKLLLSPGYNIIKLDAQDKFKTYTEKKLEIILKEY
ncbi:Ig-like domain-containing protein [Patescibacteria group bacterium]|nr:Ig-like domain-containing protein [Patescibacteria group bacterium]